MDVANQFVRGADLRRGAKLREVRRSPAKRFLQTIGDGSEEVVKEFPFLVHG